MKIVAQGNLDPVILQKLWGLDNDVSGRTTFLRNSKQSTAIELVELKPRPTTKIRDHAATYDYGLFDVCYLVSGAETAANSLKKKGVKWLTEPYTYPPLWSGSEIIEGFAYGPAKEIIASVEYIKPPVANEKRLVGDWWAMMDMAQFVENMQKAMLFYRDALGLQVVSDTVPPTGFFDEILHLPSDTATRIVLFNFPQSNDPVVEVLETSAKGKPLAASPGQIGIAMLAFESNALEADIAKVTEKGFQVLTGPVEVNSMLHGKIKAADVEGPSKIRVELFQKIQ
jgi:catechol 2,3-dioxygenase-like lactoylglutathione lyase family enzyme